jgi:hypothetical protein
MGSDAKSHMTNAASSYMVNYLHIPYILGTPSSFMTLHQNSSNFLIYEENFLFFFCQCDEARTWRIRGRTTRTR